MSIASVSYTVEAIDCSPCPLLFGDTSLGVAAIFVALLGVMVKT
jgi:hypothetical protein